MTIQNAKIKYTNTLNEKSGSPILDTQILISHILKKDSGWLFAHLEHEISDDDIKKIDKLVSRRAKGEPIAYILGHKEFFGLTFLVNKKVLIPRPESEFFVDHALAWLKQVDASQSSNDEKACSTNQFTILDIGTGSGNIIISIAKNFPNANFFASDISAEALKVAKKNANNHKINNIKFVYSDLFKNRLLHRQFDLIIANLPYVPENERDISTKFEPCNAIFAKDNGTGVMKKFLLEAKKHIAPPPGAILMELDPRNAEEILKFAVDKNYQAELSKDLAGHLRYLILKY